MAALLGHELPGSTLGTYLTTAEPDILDACEMLAGALFGKASDDQARQEALG